MDFNVRRAPQPSAKKGTGSRRAGAGNYFSREGRRADKPIKVPSEPGYVNQNKYGMDDIWANSPTNRSRPGSSNPYGHDSDSSHFSTERQKRGRQGGRKTEQRKRERDELKLAEMQREKDSPKPEFANLDDDDDERTNAPSCFDGVTVDRVMNPKYETYVNNVMQKLGTNDDADFMTVSERAKMKKRNKRNLRGTKRQRSAMERSISPARIESRRMLNRDRGRWVLASSSSSDHFLKITKAKGKKQGMLYEDDSMLRDLSWLSSSSSRERKGKQAKKKPAKCQSKLSMSSLSRSGGRRQTRSSSKSGGSKNDIITIDSSSDEDDMSVDGSFDVSENAEDHLKRMRPVGDRPAIDAVRIAIGKKVFKSKCELSIQFGIPDPYILFSYVDHRGRKNEHSISLTGGDLKEVKYFIASDEADDESDESMTVIAFRITPTDNNNFAKYSSSYHQEDSEDSEKTERRYISVEVRDADEFQVMLAQMREHPTLAVFLGERSEISLDDLPQYTQALMEDNRKERNTRLGTRTRSGGNNED